MAARVPNAAAPTPVPATAAGTDPLSSRATHGADQDPIPLAANPAEATRAYTELADSAPPVSEASLPGVSTSIE